MSLCARRCARCKLMKMLARVRLVLLAGPPSSWPDCRGPSSHVQHVGVHHKPQHASQIIIKCKSRRKRECIVRSGRGNIHEGELRFATNSPQRTPDCLPHFSSTICAQERLERVYPPSGDQAPHHSLPTVHTGRAKATNQLKRRRKAHTKPTPHPRDGDCFYKINKTSRTNKHKNVDFQQHLPPTSGHPSQGVGGGDGRRKDITLVISQHANSISPQQQPQRVLRYNQRAGGKRNGQSRRESRGRRMSDHIHILPVRAQHTVCVSTLRPDWHARGAGSNGQATGGAGASHAREREMQSSRCMLERIGRKGPRGQTDQRKIQRMRRCTPTQLSYYEEKERGSVVA